MSKFICEKCGNELNGNEEFCPNCNEKIVYKCKKCGKELTNGKQDICPFCNTECKEKADGFWGTVLPIASSIILTLGSFAIKAIISGNKSDNGSE